MRRGGVILAALVLCGCGSVSAVQPDATVDGASDASGPDAALVDAALDAPAVDAPRTAWAGPEPVLNVNTSGSSEFHPTVSGDGLELYFVRNSGGTDPGRLFVATRTSRTAPWNVPTEVAVAVGHLHPELSHDSLELYTIYNSMVHRAVRASRTAPWTNPQALFDGSTPATISDGLIIYYTNWSDGLVRARRRTSVTAAWGSEETPQAARGIYNSISVNPEGRYMLFMAPTDPFAFPNAASMVRVGGSADWSNFLEDRALGDAKAQACDFVDDTEIYCSLVDATNRHDIVRFTRN